MPVGFFTSLLFYAAIIVGSFLINIILHELGHAIPILCWSKGNVAIFIGSHGNERGSFRWRIGRLELYVLKNPILWCRGGLCRPQDRLSPVRQMLCIAMGPAASLVTALLCWWLLSRNVMTGDAGIAVTALLIVAASLLVGSVFPSYRLRVATSGKLLYNDARLFLRTWKQRKLPPEYWEALEYGGKKMYREAAGVCESLILEGHNDAEILRLANGCHLALRNFDRAMELRELIRAKYGFSADDYVNDGFYKCQLGKYEQARTSFLKALEIERENPLALYNYGYVLVVLGYPKESLPYFEKVIRVRPLFAYVYAGRAWARMNLGEWEEGLADVEKSLEADDQHAEAWRVKGLYHFEKRSMEEAYRAFARAKELDHYLPFVDEWLAETKRRLEG